jgi:hypothetical protein
VFCMCVSRLEAEVSELKKCLEKSHCDAEHMRCGQLQVSLARALSLSLARALYLSSPTSLPLLLPLLLPLPFLFIPPALSLVSGNRYAMLVPR